MKTEYSLLENFTKHGVWWLPGRPEDRVRGDLVFDGNCAKLKLFGASEGTESVFVNRDAEMILGSCGNEDITLLNCGLGERWDVMKDSITSTWWCQFALIGLHAAGGLERSRLFSDGATERSTIVAAEYGHRSLARSLFKLCSEGDI